ncbi:hypothetical protein RKD33_005859 [Streptomyces sp. SAI-129]
MPRASAVRASLHRSSHRVFLVPSRSDGHR